jgi:hypothetical protein
MPSVLDSHAPIQVYVQLLGEGVTVYRPTTGVPIGTSAVKLLAPENFDPSDEEWEFAPGSVVRVERRVLSGGEVLVAVGLYDRDR